MNKKRAWLVTIIAVFAGISIAIAQNKLVPIMIILQDEFSIDSATAGWLSSVFSAVGIIVALPGALIVNKLGARRTGVLALLFTILGTVLGMFSSNVALLMISRLIEGIGCGVIAIAIPALITMWFPANKRGLPMGLWSSWQMFAQALCFFFVVGICTQSGWRGVWGVSGIVLFAALVLFIAFVKKPADDQNYAEIETEEKVPLLGVLKYRSVWSICIAMFCFNFACFGFVTWAASCWHSVFGIDLENANRFLTYMYIWELPIVIGVGYILDRVDRKRFCILTYAGYIIAASSAFFLPSAKWILPFIVIYPIFEGAVVSGLWTAVPQTVKDSKYAALAIALFGMFQNVGMLIGPPLVGKVLDSFGWAAAAIPIAIVAAIGTVATATIKLYTNKAEA